MTCKLKGLEKLEKQAKLVQTLKEQGVEIEYSDEYIDEARSALDEKIKEIHKKTPIKSVEIIVINNSSTMED